jgi:hypothetical protein
MRAMQDLRFFSYVGYDYESIQSTVQLQPFRKRSADSSNYFSFLKAYCGI